jgi:hypothetical protein
MIIPLRKKHLARFVHPKRAGKTDNSGVHRQQKGGNPDTFYCMCGGVVKMVTIFRNGKPQPRARCAVCGEERRKPSMFV